MEPSLEFPMLKPDIGDIPPVTPEDDVRPWADGDPLPNGLFYRRTQDWEEGRIECYFHGSVSGDDYLYVFLAAAIKDMRRIFHRWKWNHNGNTLAVADPMATVHGITPGWFFGTDLCDYRSEVAKLISDIAGALGVPNNKIVVYGSSSGGTASVYISEMLEGSWSVSINPQFDSSCFKEQFAEVSRLNCEENLSKRNNMKEVFSHSMSRHLVVINKLSKKDYPRLASLYPDVPLGVSLQETNVYTWVYEAAAVNNSEGFLSGHVSQETPTTFASIDGLIRYIENGGDVEAVSPVFDMFTRMWGDYFELKQRLVYEEVERLCREGVNVKKNGLTLSLMYQDGASVESDQSKSLYWMEQSAIAGNTQSTVLALKKLRAKAYLEGDDIQFLFKTVASKETMSFLDDLFKAPDKAADVSAILEASMDCGEEAVLDAVSDLLAGCGTEVDEECVLNLLEIVESPVPKCHVFDYIMNRLSPAACGRAIYALAPLAKTGHAGAKRRLAKAYASGRGVNQDVDYAKSLLWDCCEQDNEWAKIEYFDLCWRQGSDDECRRAFEIVEPLAEAGNVRAVSRVVNAYKEGRGAERSYESASMLLEPFLESGEPWAVLKMFDLVQKFKRKEEYVPAVNAVRLLAESGNGESMARLARAYRKGTGVERNLETAESWYRSASDAGVPWAMDELAAMKKSDTSDAQRHDPRISNGRHP